MTTITGDELSGRTVIHHVSEQQRRDALQEGMAWVLRLMTYDPATRVFSLTERSPVDAGLPVAAMVKHK